MYLRLQTKEIGGKRGKMALLVKKVAGPWVRAKAVSYLKSRPAIQHVWDKDQGWGLVCQKQPPNVPLVKRTMQTLLLEEEQYLLFRGSSLTAVPTTLPNGVWSEDGPRVSRVFLSKDFWESGCWIAQWLELEPICRERCRTLLMSSPL